jgi:hypothetical protein
MFDNDLNRGEFERVYIKECICIWWINKLGFKEDYNK